MRKIKLYILCFMIIFSSLSCMSISADKQNTNIADDALKIVEKNKCVNIEYSLDGWYKSGYEVYDLEIFDSEFDGYKDYIYIFADGSRLKLNVKNIDNSVNYAEVIK